MKTFAEFLATRKHYETNIADAYGQPWDELGCDKPDSGGYMYWGDDGDYFVILTREGEDGAEFHFDFEHDDYLHYTLAAAEAELYSSVYFNTPEVAQFHDIRCTFDAYDDILPIIPGFTNDSWGNDAMPKMTLQIGDYICDLYCDFRDYNSREMPNGPQFAFVIGDEVIYNRVHSESFDVIPTGLAHIALTKILGDYCERHGLKCESADEMILRDDLTADQRSFLSDFINAWERGDA